MLGRRRSVSTSSTRAPFWATTRAVFTLVAVFSSRGNGLVIRISLGGPLSDESRIDVRNALYDSEISEFGLVTVTVSSLVLLSSIGSSFRVRCWPIQPQRN